MIVAILCLVLVFGFVTGFWSAWFTGVTKRLKPQKPQPRKTADGVWMKRLDRW